MITADFDDGHPLASAFRNLIKSSVFPCVGAKAALSRRQVNVVVCRDIRSAWDDLRVLPGLLDVIRRYRQNRALFRTFAVIFEDSYPLTEALFERHMWERIQSLSDKDDWLGFQPDPNVDSDPASPHFSLSFGGEAFFVVGLHPQSSRPARQFIRPVLVFNLHDQFVELRQQGQYEKMRETIIKRDIAVAGTPNPMLARHGETSEARQYSGRAVPADWKCPYKRRAA